MSTRVEYNAGSAIGQLVAEYVETMIEAKQKGERLAAVLSAMADGGSYEQIEAEIGGMEAGEGQSLYNLVTGAHGLLNVAGFSQLYRLDQG